MNGLGECSICTEVLEKNLATIPCGHIFHFECAKKCIEGFKRCPKCRKPCNFSNIIKLFAENSLTEENETTSEYKTLFRQLNKIVENHNQDLQSVLKRLHEKEKECERLENELMEEKCLRKSTAEHALILRKEAEQAIAMEKDRIIECQQQVVRKNRIQPTAPFMPAKSKQLIPKNSASVDKSIDVVKDRSKKFPMPAKQQKIENDYPVTIKYLDGATVCIKLNNTVIVLYPTRHVLPKLVDFKKIDICIGASPDELLIKLLTKKFLGILFLTSEDRFLRLYTAMYDDPGHAKLINIDNIYTYYIPETMSKIEITPTIGWLIKSHECTIYLYMYYFIANIFQLEKTIRKYGPIDILITKPDLSVTNVVKNHIESKVIRTVFIGNISMATKEDLYAEMRKFSIDIKEIIILDKNEEYDFRKCHLKKSNLTTKTTAPISSD